MWPDKPKQEFTILLPNSKKNNNWQLTTDSGVEAAVETQKQRRLVKQNESYEVVYKTYEDYFIIAIVIINIGDSDCDELSDSFF